MRKLDWLFLIVICLWPLFLWVYPDKRDFLDLDLRVKNLEFIESRIESQISHLPYDHQIVKGLQKEMDKLREMEAEDLPSRIYNLETKVFPDMHKHHYDDF